jgi:hypothetical protein
VNSVYRSPKPIEISAVAISKSLIEKRGMSSAYSPLA